MRPNLNLPLLLIIIFALVSGIILRVASFRWNYRIQGDVNLFALSAREFVLHNRLYYPMKYDYGNVTRYAELQSPASQHPPLWPFMAGLLAKLLSTNETFFTLKLLSEFTGLLLIAVVAYFGIRAGRVIEALFSIAGIAVSPILIDYSANGSMYILSALLIILTVILLRYFDHQNLWHYVTAGVLCGVGLEVHSALVSLILAFFLFGFWERSNLRWSGVSIYVLAALLTVTPWLAWNWINLGKLCYTSSPGYLLQKLGLVNIGLNNGGITEVMTGVLDKNTLKLYVYLFFAGVVGFLNGYITEIGPFCLFLAMVGFSQLISSRRRDLSVVLPYVAYIFVIFLWASYKYRFLVPALPAAYLASSIGFVTLYKSEHSLLKLAGMILFIGTLAWSLQSFFKEPLTNYYKKGSGYALYTRQYDSMLILAKQLKDLDPGVVLGVSRSLDGGVETIYWHELPFVYGRNFQEEMTRKLARDFNVHYIWADHDTKRQVEADFPDANLILSNEFYYVFDLEQAISH